MFLSSKQSTKARLRSRSVGGRKTALMYFNVFSELKLVKLVVEY